jgi:hypothetical protein
MYIPKKSGPNLSRIRPNHQSVPLSRFEIDRAVYGEAVEDERQAPTGDRIGLVAKTEMQVGAFGGSSVP